MSCKLCVDFTQFEANIGIIVSQYKFKLTFNRYFLWYDEPQ